MLKQKFQEFFDKYNGQVVEVNDSSNYAQCMDLAYAWCDFLSITRDAIRHLYAYEVWTKPNDLTIKHFEMFPNTPNGLPQAGDLVVFSKAINGTAGHISVAKGEGNTSSFVSFDQNFGATTFKKAGLITHGYDNVLGWLRPRVGLIPIPLPGPIITDGTKIDLGEGIGEMEVGTIKSVIRDSRRDIINLQAHIVELEAQVASPSALQGTIDEAKHILYSPNFFWIKLRKLREILPR